MSILFYSSLAGAPLTLLYLWLAPRTAGAAMLLAFAGFIVYTGYPLTVALARNADSRLRPSQRMGLMSGGTWAIAAIALWCLGPLSALTGLRPILHLIWAGYLVAALLTLSQLRKKP